MLEEKLREVIIEELKRQAEVTDGALNVEEADQAIRIQGTIDIDT
jgi:hypothetical protein